MTTPTHAALGLLIGTVTGHPVVGALTAITVDIDHLAVYAKHSVFKSPKLFWKTITNNEDPYEGQRGWLHSLFVAVPLSLVIWLAMPVWGPTIILSYLVGHIALDALDSADWPLYPSKRWNIRGPILFFSRQELILGSLFLISSLSVLLKT
jgi:membrane-bound metal-dependent hydrolase YbcI (DUF457 family)